MGYWWDKKTRRRGILPVSMLFCYSNYRIGEVQIFYPPQPPFGRGEQALEVPPHHRGDLGGI